MIVGFFDLLNLVICSWVGLIMSRRTLRASWKVTEPPMAFVVLGMNRKKVGLSKKKMSVAKVYKSSRHHKSNWNSSLVFLHGMYIYIYIITTTKTILEYTTTSL